MPVIPSLSHYLEQNCFSGWYTTLWNWNSYGHKINSLSNEQGRYVLADPQTSGGLIDVVAEEGIEDFENLLKEQHLPASHWWHPFKGRLNNEGQWPYNKHNIKLSQKLFYYRVRRKGRKKTVASVNACRLSVLPASYL